MPTVGQAQHAKDFDTLMDIDFKLHTLMSNIESKHVKEEDIAHLPANILLDAQQLIHTSIPIMEKYPKLKIFSDQVKAWVKGLDDALAIYKPDGGDIYLPYNALMLIKEKILNFASNAIHDAALASAGDVTHLKGCEVKSFKGDDAVAVSKYCGGVVPISGKALVLQTTMKKLDFNGKSKVVTYPTQVQHSLGCHKVKPSFMSIGPNQTKLAIQYSESGPSYAGSPNRMKGVRQRLELEGLECSLGLNDTKNYHGQTELYCWGEKKDEDVKMLGTYFSLLLNGDVAQGSSNPDFFEVVRDKAWEIAKKYNEKYGEDVWQNAPQNQLAWGTLYSELKKEKELYAKNVIYEDLRNLLIIRDKHHALESQYGVEEHSSPVEGMKLIKANGDEFEKILKKNKWPDSNLSYSLSNLQQYIDQGKAANITSLSDGIGHIMHMIVVKRLTGEGTYGGCPMVGDISNINAGNLSYCEGILNGTQGSLAVSGNDITHKALPNTFGIYIGDEDLSKGYRIMVTPPGESSWRTTIEKYLKKYAYACSTGKCSKYEPDLNSIRELALFFSNLKGVNEKVGEECALKAIAEANKAAKEENKKGVFAFNNDVILDNPKAWINKCHSTYGILPPGLTEEEKIIIKLIGPNKIYAGCNLADSDIIPNMGYIRYCEGVRKNPSANISAYFTSDGELHHVFHGDNAAKDEIADISITPDGKLWQVEVKNIDMKGEKLRAEAKKVMKTNWKFTCQQQGNCVTSQSLSDDQLRILAGFLSSLHQVYKLPDNCVAPSVQYALNEAMKLPKGKTAHDSIVYPFETADWTKVVCSKIPGQIMPTPPSVDKPSTEPIVTKEKVISSSYINTLLNTKGLLPLTIGGCVKINSKPLSQAKAAYCAGILTETKEKTYPHVAQLGWIDNWHSIFGNGNVVFSSKGFNLTITIPEEIAELPNVITHLTNSEYSPSSGCGFKLLSSGHYTFEKHYNKYSGSIPKAALFLSRLANVHKLPKDCQEKAVEVAWKQAKTMQISPIYPATVTEWNDEVCGVPSKPEDKILTVDEFVLALLGQPNVKKITTDEIQKYISAAGYKNTAYSVLKKLVTEGKIKHDVHEVPNLWWYEKETMPTTGITHPSLDDILAAPWNYSKIQQKVPGIEPYHKCFKEKIAQLTGYGNLVLTDYFVANNEWLSAHNMTVDKLKMIWNECVQEVQAATAEEKDAGEIEEADMVAHPWKYNMKNLHAVLKGSDIAHCFAHEVALLASSNVDKAAGLMELYPSADWIASQANEYGISGSNLKQLWAKCYKEWKEKILVKAGTKAKSDIKDLQFKAAEKAQELYTSMSKSEIEKLNSTKEYKKLPQKGKAYLHALMEQYLLDGEITGQSFDKTLEELQFFITKAQPLIPITPLMVKLQTEIEKKRLIRKGYLPAESGQVVSKKYGDLSPDEKQAVHDFIDAHENDVLILADVMEHFGLIDSPMLAQVVKDAHMKKKKRASDKLTVANIKELIKNTLTSNEDEEICEKGFYDHLVSDYSVDFADVTLAIDQLHTEHYLEFIHSTAELGECYALHPDLKTHELEVEEKPSLSPQALKNEIYSIFKQSGPTDITGLFKALEVNYTLPKGVVGTEGTVSWAIDQLKNEGLIESQGMAIFGIKEQPSTDISQLILEQKTLYYNLGDEVQHDKELLSKCKAAKAYKNLPQKCKDLIHANMNLQLLNDHQNGKSFNDTLNTVTEVVIKTFPNLTPLQVKLQLEIEKKNKIRKGELPEEKGEKPAKFFQNLKGAELSEVQDSIISDIEEGWDVENTANRIKKKYGLIETQALIDFITQKSEEYDGESSEEEEEEIEEEPKDDSQIIAEGVKKLMGKNLDEALSPYAVIDLWMQDKKLSNWGEPSHKEVLAALKKLQAQGEVVTDETGMLFTMLSPAKPLKAKGKKKEMHVPSALEIEQFIMNTFATGDHSGWTVEEMYNEAAKGWDVSLNGIKTAMDFLLKEGQLGLIKDKYYVKEAGSEESDKTSITTFSPDQLEQIKKDIATSLAGGASEAEVLKYLNDTDELAIDDALMNLVVGLSEKPKTFQEEEEEQVDSDISEGLIDYSDLSSEDEPQVDADIAKAVSVGTTKQELLIYLEEAYNLAPDNPTLNDLINKAYAKKKPAKAKKIIAESSWGGAKKDDFSLSHYLMELLKNNPEVAFTAAMAYITILNTKGVDITEAEVDEILTELVKSGHVIVYATEKKTYQWNPYQPVAGEVKQIPFSSLPDPVQSSILGMVCMMKKQGNSLVEIFDWFAKTHPHVEFGTMTKGILTNIYEKQCVDIAPKLKLWQNLTLKEQEEIAKYVYSQVGSKTGYEIISDIESIYVINPDGLPNITWLSQYAQELIEAEKTGIPPGKKIKSTKELKSVITQIFTEEPGYAWITLHGVKKSIHDKGYEVPQDDAIIPVLQDLVAAGVIDSDSDTKGWRLKKTEPKKESKTTQPTIEELVGAFKILGIGDSIGGCKVKTKLTALNGATVAYCQGVKAPAGERADANIKAYGTVVEHKTDAQTIKIISDITAGVTAVRLHYLPKEHGNWSKTLKGAKKTLTSWDFDCEDNGFDMSCGINRKGDKNGLRDTDASRIRQAAIFLSSIDKIPLLPPTCVPKAIAHAKMYAEVEGAEVEGVANNAFLTPVYPNTTKEWDELVCSAKKVKT